MKQQFLSSFFKTVFFIFLLSVGGCTGTKKSVEGTENSNGEKATIIIFEPNIKIPEKIDVTIDSAVITGDILEIKVLYSGGCNEHEFKMISPGIDGKANGQVKLFLLHDPKGDACRELLEKKMKFNLKPLRKKGQSPTEIIINNKKILRYKF